MIISVTFQDLVVVRVNCDNVSILILKIEFIIHSLNVVIIIKDKCTHGKKSI